MKNILLTLAISSCVLTAMAADGDRLVILHTNDTHSQIDPNDKNLGGILRRKVLIDSVRAVEPNVLLVDAGDAVQGTLFYTFFKGEVERKMMNNLGYDIQILGNHEFDNGMDDLAREWRLLEADRLASNYDFTGTPMEGVTIPYTVRKFGDKTIGFMGINIDPAGIIDDKKTVGVKYLDGVEAANSTATLLREKEGADMVVAVTHIGYADEPGYADTDIVKATRGIDVVIGGHSHTTIDPSSPKSLPWWLTNADGDSVLVVQTGSRGVNLGEITVDLNTMTPSYRLIRVDKRLDSSIDPEAEAILSPYRQAIDSIQSIRIGETLEDMQTDEPGLLNFVSDFVLDAAAPLSPDRKIDLAIMNKGGIRCGIPRGPITKGRVMMMLPFDNRIQILDIKGKDLLRAFDVMASRGGDGVSRGVKAVIDPTTRRCQRVTINGKLILPEQTYRVATIDYLANGGDYMKPLTKATKVAHSDVVLYDSLIDFFTEGPLKRRPLKPDNEKRMFFNLK